MVDEKKEEENDEDQPIYKGAKRLLGRRKAPIVIEATVAVLFIIALTISCKLSSVIIYSTTVPSRIFYRSGTSVLS